ncbi:MAG: protease inhibitor I42 family protein [Clostridia bacterium]|nr:protease inhibitor I42 family protein [Clostridia bacterium]
MKTTRRIIISALLVIMCLSLFSCGGGEKAVVVSFPKNNNAGYYWDDPAFDAEAFKLSSQRSFSEQAPGMPTTTYHEWTFTPLKAGTYDITFVQYDSKETLESKTDPFRKVIITYEISDKLTVKELSRNDLNYKQDEE